MSVITVTGNVGAGEELIAGRIGDDLGYRVLERPQIEEILKEYGIVEYEKLLDSPPRFFDGLVDKKQDVNDLLSSIYLLFAKRNNCVIVSKRAFFVLEPFLNVMNVFIKAPLSVRIDNVMKWEHVDQDAAREIIGAEEEIRKGIIDAFYHEKRDSLELWSMVVDSRKFGMDRIIDMIKLANEEVAKNDALFGWQDGMPTTDTIETDQVLENVVNRVVGAPVEMK